MSNESEFRSVNHRGYSAEAPENTLPAYRLSEQKGFRYVETDVSFTSDGIPLLLHDATIDRTSNGSGKLSEMTFFQARQYDFGSWKSPAYAGTRIPTLAEFLSLCRDLFLYPYIELKPNGDYTRQQIESIIDLADQYGFHDKATYISFAPEYLRFVRDAHPSSRLGYLKSRASSGDVEVCRSLKTPDNQVFYDVKYTTVTQEVCSSFAAAGIPIEVWTVNQPEAILELDPYISGVTSDSQLAGKLLEGRPATRQGQNQILKTEARGICRLLERLRILSGVTGVKHDK